MDNIIEVVKAKLTDPDAVGQSEYTLLYDFVLSLCVNAVIDGSTVEEAIDHIFNVMDEVKEWAGVIQNSMHYPEVVK